MFRCAYCAGEFEKGRPDEVAMEEMRGIYGDMRPDELEVVCDACFKLMDPANNLHLVEQSVAEHIRERPSA